MNLSLISDNPLQWNESERLSKLSKNLKELHRGSSESSLIARYFIWLLNYKARELKVFPLRSSPREIKAKLF